MADPFDDEGGTYVVLRNDHGQCSLWPTFAAVPAGWTVVHGPGDRAGCVRHVVGLESGMSISRMTNEEPVR